MATTTGSAGKKKSSDSTKNAAIAQQIASVIHAKIQAHFPSLRDIANIESIVLSLMHVESSLRPYAIGVQVSSAPGTTGHSFINDSEVKTKAAQGVYPDPIMQGLRAWGLGQIMGWYLYKNTKLAREFMQNPSLPYYPLAVQYGLLVDMGTDLGAIFSNDINGITRGVMATLITLDYKYNIFLRKNRDSYGKNVTNSGKYDALRKAIQSYLGTQGAKDVLGSDPVSYANNILNGAGSYTTYASVENKNTTVASTDSTQVTKPATGCASA